MPSPRHLPASTVAAFKSPAIHALSERKHSNSKDRMTVIGHVCRKMVSIIFVILFPSYHFGLIAF